MYIRPTSLTRFYNRVHKRFLGALSDGCAPHDVADSRHAISSSVHQYVHKVLGSRPQPDRPAIPCGLQGRGCEMPKADNCAPDFVATLMPLQQMLVAGGCACSGIRSLPCVACHLFCRYSHPNVSLCTGHVPGRSGVEAGHGGEVAAKEAHALLRLCIMRCTFKLSIDLVSRGMRGRGRTDLTEHLSRKA